MNLIRAELADAHETEQHFLDLWDEYGAEYGDRLTEASERVGRLQLELASCTTRTARKQRPVAAPDNA